jgi:hypothetical protein
MSAISVTQYVHYNMEYMNNNIVIKLSSVKYIK